MARVSTHPKRSTFSGEELAAFDRVAGRFGRGVAPGDDVIVEGHMGAMLNRPLFAEPLSRLGICGRSSGHHQDSFSDWEREWADQVVSHHLKTTCLLKLHIPDG